MRDDKLGVKFRRQHPVSSYYVDFYCVEAGLAIELDGPIHDRQVEEDRDRQAFIEANNIQVLRFSNEDVLKRMPQVLTTIRSALADSSS